MFPSNWWNIPTASGVIKGTLETVIPNRYVAKIRQVACHHCHASVEVRALATAHPARSKGCRRLDERTAGSAFASLMPVNALYSGGYAISWGVNPCFLDRLKNCQWHKLSQSLFFID